MRKEVAFLFLMICFFGFGSAAPEISGLSGSFNDGQTITINGLNFGPKSSAAPTVWDDCSGNNIYDIWDGAWPENSECSSRIRSNGGIS